MPPEASPPAAGSGEEPPPSSAEALPALIEALLFVSDGPVEASALAQALGVSRRRVEQALEPLAGSLAGHGVRLQIGPQGVQLVTAPEAAAHVEYFLGLEAKRRLSPAALETLAIVAYRQPVTRAIVESIRGVNSDAAIATLRSRELIAEGGRAPGPGRATLFVTTQRFLEHFGLERPDQLPALDELGSPPAAPTAGEPEGAAEQAPPAVESDDGSDVDAPPAGEASDRRRRVTGARERPGAALPGTRTGVELPSSGVRLPPAAGMAPPAGERPPFRP